MTMPLTTDPRREIEMLRPRAIASSFPLNHFATIADYATLFDSPPSPNMTLPAIIIPSDRWYPPIANTP